MQPPKIDKRTYNEIIKDISRKLPYYAPQLKFDEAQKDATGALIKIFAGMFEGTLKNLNRVPEKNHLAFLNMLGTKLLPSEPARVPLTFKLSKGTKNPVFIRQGTKVSANPQDGGSPVTFETEKGILAVVSKLQGAYYVSKEKDFISQIPQGLLSEDIACASSGEGTALFDFLNAENLQSHVFYIGDRELFNICKQVKFRIEASSIAGRIYDIIQKNRMSSIVEWFYFAGESEDKKPVWKPFDYFGVNKDPGYITLYKNNSDEIRNYKINGIESRWIKCKVNSENVNDFVNLKVNPADIKGEWILTEMVPDRAYYNSIPLKMVKGKKIYPFGQTPRTNDTFYLSCNEALAIQDEELTVSFSLFFDSVYPRNSTEAPITAKLSWEYWNGNSWARLETVTENNLNSQTNNSIKFKSPNDIKITSVNGEKGLWLRVRIVSGDYGREVVIQNGQQFSLEPRYKVPCINNITISASGTKKKQVDEFITYNNLDFYRYDRIYDKEPQNVEIVSIPYDSYPSFYLSFDKAFEKGPVSILFSIEDRAYTKENIPRIRWEYYSKSGEWKNMEVSDDGTQNLTRTGILVFSMPPDFALSLRFGKNLYWIRAVDLSGKYDGRVQGVITPVLKGIYLNTTWASQSETIENETFSSSGNHSQEFTLSKKSVTYHEIWINEINSLTEADRLEIFRSGKFRVTEIKDTFGVTKEFWIKWHQVSDILFSGRDHRSYEIDPAFGLIRFGDGSNGAVPPIGTDNIRVVYKAGGGSRGNLGTGLINSMNSSISFVEGVFNPEPSKGGFEMETTGQMLKRASKIIRNRGKAVTAKDFEELAMEASRSIARVKCLPNTNDKDNCETGWVTLVVLPQSRDERPVCSPELMRRIEEYILLRTSNCIVFPKNFRVINPGYMEISVNAVVKAADIELMLEVEKKILSGLSDFLNPIRGGARGEGWDFGRMPYFSDFYALLERIPGIDYVDDLSLLITDPDKKNSLTIDTMSKLDMKNYILKPYALVSNGKHSITLKI